MSLGLADVFLTILHPDRDGPVTRPMSRLLWRVAVVLARGMPGRRRDILAMAGPSMLALTMIMWMALPILGFALIVWPGLGTDYLIPRAFAPYDFGDAVYFSAVAFTTLGFGDVTPLTGRGEMIAILEAVSGFMLGAAAIAFILNVFHGVDRRDGMALRALAESGGSWSGIVIARRALEVEGVEGLRRRTDGWAIMLRGLHERFYRFQALAFYIRTRGSRHEPERMFAALAEFTLAVNILARTPGRERLALVADTLAVTLVEFTRSLARHHGTRAQNARIDEAVPSHADLARLAEVVRGLGLVPTAAVDADLGVLSARIGVYLDLLERITLWGKWRRADG